MNKTLLLAKILLKNGSGTWGKRKNGKTSGLKGYLLLPLLAVAFIPIASAIAAFTSFLYDGFVQVGQEGAILGLGLAAVSAAIFVFGIFYVINVFYFSQDVEHLLPLPLKPSQILSAKFAVTLVYEYLTELLFLMPIAITFGVKSGAGPLYYVYLAIVFLTLPIVPLVIASIIAMVVMRFTNIAKNKDRFRMIGGIVAIALGLGANLFAQRLSRNGMTPQQMQEALTNGDLPLLDMATRMFPTVKLGAKALLESMTLQGIAALVMFVSVSVLVFVLFALLGEWMYFKGVMGASESTAKRIKVSNEQLGKQTAQSSPLKSLFLRELRTLVRTPPFFLNCVLISFLWPVIISIPLFTQKNNLPSVSELQSMLNEGSFAGIVLGASFALFLFLSGTNATASTAISREGVGAFVLKFLPIKYAQVILAKTLTGYLLSMVSVVLVLLMAVFVLHLPVYIALLMLLLSLPGVLFANFVGILIDSQFPKLHWDTEQKAVKQNFNVMISLFINLIVAGIVIGSILYFGWSLPMVFIVLFAVFTIANALLYRIITRNGQKWLQKLEL